MQSEIPEIKKLEALRAVQFAGVIGGLIAAFVLPDIVTIPPDVSCAMKWVIGIAGLLTSIALFSTNHTVKSLMETMGMTSSGQGVSFTKIVRFCAGVDLVALAYLIYATGGSRQSLFVPYLFVIVPVTIILQDSKRPIAIYFVMTVVICWVCLWLKCSAFQVHYPEHSYNIAYGAVTTLCVFLPTGLKLFGPNNAPSSSSAP
jgi:hypothetical protein